MLIYWLMFLMVAMTAIVSINKQVHRSSISWIFVWIGFTLIIGLRHQVGGDWYNYLRRFNQAEYLTFEQMMSIKDFGYQFISYYAYEFGWGFYALNVICAMIFVSGLIAFLNRQINPWLALTVAVPYLIIVVVMGYTRQGVAIGLVLWALSALDKGQFKRFIIFIGIAVTFHKSAILMISFGIFQSGKGKFLKILAIFFVAIAIWMAFVGDSSSDLWKTYVEKDMQSQGAMIRVLLNLLPSLLLLLFRKQWKEHFNDYRFWFMIAVASIMSVGLVGVASTAVDRMALYFIPIQMVVFSRLPFLARKILSPKITTILIVLLYALIMFVWLNFGTHASYWVPYNNILFEVLFKNNFLEITI